MINSEIDDFNKISLSFCLIELKVLPYHYYLNFQSDLDFLNSIYIDFL
jgi:hypothetical protein